MSKLYFRYGAMNSGKSISIAVVAYNYEERGQSVIIIKPGIDTKSDSVISRVGLSRGVDILINPEDDSLEERILDLVELKENVSCVIVDEAQFLTPHQVDSLFNIAVIYNIPVICYGLRADFQTLLFPGSKRLLELSHSIEELKTICRCGKKAIFNAREVDGVFVAEGEQIAIDGEVNYESKCAECYIKDVRNGKEF